jgi:hypothetical protein
MSDLAGFASSGGPVLRRPSGRVNLNRCVAVDASGSIVGGSAGRLVTILDMNFLGFNNGTGSLIGTNSFAGIPLIGYSNGSGGAVDAVAGGFRLTWPNSSAESCIYVNTTGPLQEIIGQDRWRRGRIGLWCKYSNFTMPVGSYTNAPALNFSYPDCGFLNRRAQTTWQCGGWYNGTENTNTQVNSSGATEDVSLIYFRSPWECEHYRGTWNNITGWPLMEDMTFGGVTKLFLGVWARFDSAVNRNKLNTLANGQFQLLLVGGGNNTNSMVLERSRITAWE